MDMAGMGTAEMEQGTGTMDTAMAAMTNKNIKVMATDMGMNMEAMGTSKNKAATGTAIMKSMGAMVTGIRRCSTDDP